MPKKNKQDKDLKIALKTIERWRLTPNEMHKLENFHRCAQCDLDNAISLLRESLPIVNPKVMSKCRSNQDTTVQAEIRGFLKEIGIVAFDLP